VNEIVKIAACQIKVTEDTDKNLKKILKYLEEAGKKKIDIICFPEKSLQWHNVQYKDLTLYLRKIGGICKKYSMYCLVGGVVLKNNKKMNNAYLINRDGEIQAIHSKVNLFYLEKEMKLYKAGNKMTVVETDFGKIGISVCWDNNNPKLIRELSKKGAKIIFALMHLNNWKKYDYKLPEWPKKLAKENNVYYVWVDMYKTNDSSSQSFILSPKKVLKSIKDEEGIIYEDVNLS